MIEHARTPAEGLLAVAGRTQARGIVVGSTRDGSIYRYVGGRGRTASCTMPCAGGPGAQELPRCRGRAHARATCAHAGLDDTPEALTEAGPDARHEGAAAARELRRARQADGPTGAGYDIEHAVPISGAASRGRARGGARERLPADLAVESAIGDGDSWRASLTSIPWQDEWCLVIEFQLRGMLARVFLGSASTAIIQHAPVPVIAVPLAAAREGRTWPGTIATTRSLDAWPTATWAGLAPSRRPSTPGTTCCAR
ncbi:MAG: hypothetical protein U1E17_01225 [Geminicoccaceae bacterium]